MTRSWIIGLALVAACGGNGSKDSNPVDVGWCDDAAIKSLDGSVDDCDLQACQACAEACGGNCMVLESFPPQYACEGEGSWSVYDFCEDWQMPEFNPCDDTTSSVASDDATALGFSGDDVVAALVGPFDEDAEYVAEEGRSDTVVHLTVAANGAPTLHDLEPSDTTGSYGADPQCADYLEVPVTLTLSTDDGAFDETVQTSIWASDLAALSASGELDWQALTGTFQFVTIDPSQWDEVTISLETMLTPSASGQIAVSANRDLGGGMGEGMVGPLLRWPPQ